MQTLQINIEDRLISKIGLASIKERLQKEIEFLYFENLADEIYQAIEKSNIDNEKELEIARQQAWDDYKQKFIKGIE